MSFFTANLGISQGYRLLTGRSISYEATNPADAEIAWNMRGAGASKGKMQKAGYNVGDAASYSDDHTWAFPASGWGSVSIRLSYEAGSDTVTSSSHAIDGATWHTMTEDSDNIFWTTRHTAVLGDTTTVIKVELSIDGGTTVLDTGTYQSICTVAA